jgi:hypothetical protein
MHPRAAQIGGATGSATSSRFRRWRAGAAFTLALGIAMVMLLQSAGPAYADGPTSLGTSTWQGARPYSPVPNISLSSPSPIHGDLRFYNYIPSPGVPAENAASWTACGSGNPLCPNATTIAMAQASRLGGPGLGCLASADFTFFQSFVSIPAGTTISTATVNFSGADDGAKILIFNSAYRAA